MLPNPTNNPPPPPRNLNSSPDAWDPYAEVATPAPAQPRSRQGSSHSLPGAGPAVVPPPESPAFTSPLPSSAAAAAAAISSADISKEAVGEKLDEIPLPGPKPEEADAILAFDEAENRLPLLLSVFFRTLPYFTLAGLFLTPAWPEPSQVLLGYYSIAYFLGLYVVKRYNNPWLKYSIFLSPLVLAALARFSPVIGRILLCQVTTTPRNLAYIENFGNATMTASWVDSGCRGYLNRSMSQREIGFLAWEVVFLIMLVLVFLQAMLEKKELMGRVADYAERLRDAQRAGAGVVEEKGDEAV